MALTSTPKPALLDMIEKIELPYHGDMATVLAYGPSGAGKTTDALYSFPNALYICQPGALKPSFNVVGYDPPLQERASTVRQATAIVQKSIGKGLSAVVCDDLSLLCDGSQREHAAAKLTGFALWGAIFADVMELRDVTRNAKMHVVFNAHEKGPNSDKATRGGPALPGQLLEKVPTHCDLTVRTFHDTSRNGWPKCYRCAPDTDNAWITRDRHGTTPDKAPMNLAEILRFAGYTIPRAPGLEWQEEIVTVLADALMETKTKSEQQALMREAVEIISEKTSNPLHIRWVMRDATDRSALHRMRPDVLKLFTGV